MPSPLQSQSSPQLPPAGSSVMLDTHTGERAPSETLCLATQSLRLVVSKVAGKAGSGEKAKLVTLGSLLFEIAHGLDHLGFGAQLPADKKIHQLLATLEWACTFRSTSRIAGVPGSAYPVLNQMISGETRSKDVRKSLKALIRKDDERKRLLSRLRRFIGYQSVGNKGQVILIPQPPEYVCYPKDVASRLYRVLESNSRCKCATDGGINFERHIGCLELHRSPDCGQDGSTAFTAAFRLASCHSCAHWQLLRFLVSRPKTEKRARIYNDLVCEESGSKSSSLFGHLVNMESGGFCKLLKEPLGPVSLQLHIGANDSLHLHTKPLQADRNLMSHPYMTLSEALETRKLSDEAKLLLALTIAYSTWQFYDSEWTDRRWTSKRIVFCRQHSASKSGLWADTEYDPLRPLVTMAFDQLDQIEHQIEEEFLHGHFGVMPCAPRILALGILLKDILGQQPRQALLESPTSWQAALNTELFECRRVAEDKAWPEIQLRSHAVHKALKDVVVACADPELFGNPEMKTVDRKNLLHDRIVWPLQFILQCANLDPKAATWIFRNATDRDGHELAPVVGTTAPSHTFSGMRTEGNARVHAGHNYYFLGENSASNDPALLSRLQIGSADSVPNG